jgi:hypothetical protein
VAGCGGSATEKTANRLSRSIDRRHLSGTTATPPHHAVVPKVSCKVKLEPTFYAANDEPQIIRRYSPQFHAMAEIRV